MRKKENFKITIKKQEGKKNNMFAKIITNYSFRYIKRIVILFMMKKPLILIT